MSYRTITEYGSQQRVVESNTDGERMFVTATERFPEHIWLRAYSESPAFIYCEENQSAVYVHSLEFQEDRETVDGMVVVPTWAWFHIGGWPDEPSALYTDLQFQDQGRFVHLHTHSEYCLAPETRVATANLTWKKIKDVEIGEELVGFDEDLRAPEEQRGNSRSKMKRTTVLGVKKVMRDCYRITLEDGTTMVASAQHGWVSNGTTIGSQIEPYGPSTGWGVHTRRWVATEQLKPGKSRLILWAKPWEDIPADLISDSGWLAGIADGEGWLTSGTQFHLAQNPGPVMDKMQDVCRRLGYDITPVRTQSSRSSCQTFRFQGYETSLRFLAQCRPVRFADRMDDLWVGRRAGSRYTRPVLVTEVEHLGETETIALQTSTKTFVAEGFLTHNSALDGLGRVGEMLDHVARDGQVAMALTDHGNCASHPELQAEADKRGMKPIFGMEAYFQNDRFQHDTDTLHGYWHLTLWAMDDVGLRNLWAMSTEGFADGLYGGKPRIDWDTLERFNGGVLASTGCLRGPVSHELVQDEEKGRTPSPEAAETNLGRLHRIFGDRLYVELHTNQLLVQREVNLRLVEMATRHAIPMVAAVDAHYVNCDDQHTHDVWLRTATGKDIGDELGMFGGGQHYHLHTEAEVREALAYLGSEVADAAIRETGQLAARCTAKIENKPNRPVYSRKLYHDDPIAADVDKLIAICEENWDRRTKKSGVDQNEYMERFEYEMELLIDKQFCGYFLMEWDLVAHAKKNRILVGPGRGSGGGSLVAYLMGITEIDPVRHGLLFARFMTKGREELPDFDIDFPKSAKMFMTNYVRERWGADHVAVVGTHLRLKNKSVIDNLGRVFKSQLPPEAYAELKAFNKLVDAAEADTAGLGKSWEDLWVQHEEELEPYREKYPDLFALAGNLVGRLKTYAKHAAGLIIDPDTPLTGALPLRQADDGQMVTQFDFPALELLGYVKFDLLNLRTLDTIQQTVDLILERSGHWIDIYEWEEEYNDPAVFDEICRGYTLGHFQTETNQGTTMMKRLKPCDLNELADGTTLVRPGPFKSGLTDTFLRRRNGEQAVSYPDPRLESVLDKTFGCFAGETSILTRQGTQEISKLAGARHELMTTRGVWVEAEVRSFGVQPLRKIMLRRNKQTKMLFATPEHRWFAGWNGTKDRDRELVTTELRPGMSLTAQMPYRNGRTHVSSVGVAAGVVYGDGVRTEHQSYVDLHGAKNAELLRFFPEPRIRHNTDQHRYSEPYLTVTDLPRSWKSLPELDEGTSYLYGWLAGYFAADGCVDKSGSPVISSTDKASLQHFRTIANLVGVGTYGITNNTAEVTLPSGEKKWRVMFTMGLVPSTLNAEFFALSEHRARFERAEASRVRADRVRWTVESVEDIGRESEVFCAVVPGTHAFVLEDHILTGNCIVYQEDVMQTTMVLAGYDDLAADHVRKVLGKKKVEQAKVEGEKFIAAAVERGGELGAMNKLWAQMAEFAKYSFNRAHAFAYAILCYWTAWLKYHYPLEFLCATLSTVDADRFPEFVEEARRLGFKVLPPDINDSRQGFACTDTTIRYGLDSIKGVGEAAVGPIIAAQPFLSWEDFRERQPSKVNIGHVKALVHIGAFDSLVPNRQGLERRIAEEEIEAEKPVLRCTFRNSEKQGAPNDLPCEYDWDHEPKALGRSGKPLKNQKEPPKKCTKGCRQFLPLALSDPTIFADYTEADIRNIEMDVLGVYLSSTPFDRIPIEEKENLATAIDVMSGDNGAYMLAAIVRGGVRLREKNGNRFGFVSLYTEQGTIDAIVFDKYLKLYEEALNRTGMKLISIIKNDRGQQLSHLIELE